MWRTNSLSEQQKHFSMKHVCCKTTIVRSYLAHQGDVSIGISYFVSLVHYHIAPIVSRPDVRISTDILVSGHGYIASATKRRRITAVEVLFVNGFVESLASTLLQPEIEILKKG